MQIQREGRANSDVVWAQMPAKSEQGSVQSQSNLTTGNHGIVRHQFRAKGTTMLAAEISMFTDLIQAIGCFRVGLRSTTPTA